MTAAQHKGRRLAKRNPRLTVLAGLSILSAIALAFVLGYNLAILKVDKPPQAVTAPAAASTPAPSTAPAEPPEPVRHRDDIVSEGRLLPYDLQELMQNYCEAYNVPYALALAIAEVETHFDPDAVSPTHDYGLMQINQMNHEWLQGLGMDPLTYAGNIEAGLYMIGGYLDTYKDVGAAFSEGFDTFDAFADGWASDAFQAGASWGDGVADKVSGMFDGLAFDPSSLGNVPGGANFGNMDPISYDNLTGNVGDIADNTGATADALELSGEELKYLRDIAERDAVNRFTTAEVKIDMTGMTNKIDGGADLDGVIRELTDGFTEALLTAAEGVHT